MQLFLDPLLVEYRRVDPVRDIQPRPAPDHQASQTQLHLNVTVIRGDFPSPVTPCQDSLVESQQGAGMRFVSKQAITDGLEMLGIVLSLPVFDDAGGHDPGDQGTVVR